MNVSLTPELEAFVQNKVESGRYNSASEVVREALRLLEAKEESRAERLAAFNGELKRRLDGLDRGEFITDVEFKKSMRERLKKLNTRSGKP